MSLEHLKSMGVFAEVAASGSFRGAARALGMTPSSVAYHVQQLEERLGTPLLYRSTRKLSLTEAGQRLAEAAQSMRHMADIGMQGAASGAEQLQGALHISLTVSLLRSPISRALARFQQQNPDVALRLTYSDAAHDLIADRIDLALRVGTLDSSALKCRRIWTMQRALVASPDLLARHTPIQHPDDLTTIPWIKHANLSEKRRFTSTTGDTRDVVQYGSLKVDNIEAMVDLALHGMALASPPRHYIEAQLRDGSLVEILSDWKLAEIPVQAIWPDTKVENPLTRAFLTVLAAETGTE
ncbi:LysR family transcriptional regulator [Tropicibacter sp. R15_0]|uniref:LysR family transcriptional regulator n=1 Tax=Tropicibacter sp. R15_0 TaxID=2821101 RepID=UPI001ADC5B2A|nr:LysR family transcriptional regulator [Tropicibacter sp. R15_0]MBO9467865.1 LysR family transcriptional regulator [Tropicibacter sp. R15_0]